MIKFHHPNDKKANEVIEDFRAGDLLSGEIKAFASDFISDFLKDHQKKKKKEMKTAEKMVYG